MDIVKEDMQRVGMTENNGYMVQQKAEQEELKKLPCVHIQL